MYWHMLHYASKIIKLDFFSDFQILCHFPEIDPFTNKLSWSMQDVIKVFILSLTLAPLRLICIIFLLFCIWITCKIALLGLSFEETTAKPFTGWRQNLNWLVHKLLRAVVFCMGIHWISVKGEQVSSNKCK